MFDEHAEEAIRAEEYLKAIALGEAKGEAEGLAKGRAEGEAKGRVRRYRARTGENGCSRQENRGLSPFDRRLARTYRGGPGHQVT